jgi:hypothetical protein
VERLLAAGMERGKVHLGLGGCNVGDVHDFWAIMTADVSK